LKGRNVSVRRPALEEYAVKVVGDEINVARSAGVGS